MLGFSDTIFLLVRSADFSITRRRKTSGPDRIVTSGRDRSLVGSCGVSRLTALADQAGINDFAPPAPPAPPSAVRPKSNWV
jgi:hypothetical protein